VEVVALVLPLKTLGTIIATNTEEKQARFELMDKNDKSLQSIPEVVAMHPAYWHSK
jgi:hypothetical protein